MIRTKDRFYWKDRLYLSRAQDQLRCVLSQHEEDLYQCKHCYALIRFRLKDTHKQSGFWIRLKPYEYNRLMQLYPPGDRDKTPMEKMTGQTEKELYRCRICASYWWRENHEWIRADDELIEANQSG